MRKNTGILLSIFFLLFLFFPQQNAWAMHIMEGFLPLKWCLFWGAAAAPFVLAGFTFCGGS